MPTTINVPPAGPAIPTPTTVVRPDGSSVVTLPTPGSSLADPAGVGIDYLYTPKGWRNGFLTALERAPVVPMTIAFLGLSISFGQAASDQTNNAWPALLRTTLLARYNLPLAALGYTPMYSTNYATPYNGSPPWSVNATQPPTSWTPGLFGKYPEWTTAKSQTNILNFSPANIGLSCTEMDLIAWDGGPSGASWQYNVDNGAQQTVTLSGANRFFRVAGGVLAGLPSGSHAIHLGVTSAGSVMRIAFATAYPNGAGAPGLGFAHIAYGGSQLLAEYGPVTLPTDGYRFLEGVDGSSAQAPITGFPFAPAFATIDWFGNDMIAGAGIQGFRNGLRRVIESLRRGNPNCSILLVGSNIGDDALAGSGGQALNGGNRAIYVQQLVDMARFYCCAYVDFQQLWNGQGVSLGYQTSTQFHPTDAGHAAMAAVISQLL